jgi:hypothetical protein
MKDFFTVCLIGCITVIAFITMLDDLRVFSNFSKNIEQTVINNQGMTK